MAQRLKRWESPRESGRNEKGRGGSARQRQLKKQHKLLVKRLRQQSQAQEKQAKDGDRPPGPSSNPIQDKSGTEKGKVMNLSLF